MHGDFIDEFDPPVAYGYDGYDEPDHFVQATDARPSRAARSAAAPAPSACDTTALVPRAGSGEQQLREQELAGAALGCRSSP
tara:strand:- start:1227 stop:1472 length:246 start_codon:yes stop_codon:yes gene_type:complete